MVFQPSPDSEQRRPLWERFTWELRSAQPERPPVDETGEGLRLETNLGDIHCLLHRAETSNGLGVLWAPGSRGGFRGPADGLYPTLAQELAAHGVTSLRLDYRHHGDLDEATLDVLAGAWHLEDIGCERIALVGHSFGGGVVISAARYASRVRSVAALASQTLGAEDAVLLGGRRLLLVHGDADVTLPASNAHQIAEWAPGPTQVAIFPGAGHGLRECAGELRGLLSKWLLEA